jgi:hypothetical protein
MDLNEFNWKNETKKKFVELVYEVLKSFVYIVAIFLFVKFVKEDIIKYINEYNRAGTLRSISLEETTKREAAANNLLYSLKSLQYRTSCALAKLETATFEKKDQEPLIEAVNKYGYSKTEFVSFCSDAAIHNLIYRIDQSSNDLLNIISNDSPINIEDQKAMKCNLNLMEKYIIQLLNALNPPN